MLTGQLLRIFHEDISANWTLELLVHHFIVASWYFDRHHLVAGGIL